MDKEKHIVILIPGFPKNKADTTCLPAQQAFIKSVNTLYPSIQLTILAFQYPYLEGDYSWHDTQVIAFGGNNKGGLSRGVLWYKIKKKLKQLHSDKPISGILSFWCGECALIGKKMANRFGIPHYCWIMGQDAKNDNRFVSRIRPDSHELIAISDFTRDEFAKNHLVLPAQVIPLGVNELKTSDVPDRDIDLLGVGSLIPLKQYDLFIQVVKKAREAIPGICAVICGKGPEEKRLMFLIEKEELQENIQLKGEVPYEDVLKLMKKTRILLHPSSFEGFSGACLETLAAGAHVISITRPMKQDIDHWHIVTAEMLNQKIIEFLQKPLEHQPVIPFPMEQTTKNVMTLFL